MNILCIAPLYQVINDQLTIGSIERVIKALLRELTAFGHNCYTSALKGSYLSGNLIAFDTNINNYELQNENLFQYLSNNSIDVVHIHRRNFLSSTAFQLCNRKRIPVLYTLHGTFDAVKILGLENIHKTSKNLFFNGVSKFQYKQLLKLLPLESYIYNGCDVLESEIQNERDFLLVIGRIVTYKGISEAIKLASATKQKLIIVGPIQDMQYFRNEIEPSLNSENICYVGPMNDQEKEKYYKGAKAVLMLGQYEDPCPLVVLEALSFGTPVIAFEKGGIPELITNGVTGFVIDTIEEGISVVQKLHEIDPLHCVERARLFSWYATAKNYIHLYHRIIGMCTS